MNKTLWIVGQAFTCKHCSKDGNLRCWEFAGVFDSEALAVAACREANYFVCPQELNKPLPHEPTEMPGAYYPLAG